MADDKKYYYMRLKENFFDDDSILILESMPDGIIYSNILLKLYLKSLKNDGKLMFNDRIPYNSQMLATITRQQVGTVEKAMRIFLDMGLIEVMDSGAIYMMDIQSYIGKSSTEADRVREYRKRINAEKKLLPAGQDDEQMPVQMYEQTSGQTNDKNTPEIEIDIEIEKEIEKEAQSASAGKPAASPSSSRKSGKKTKADTDAILQRYTTDEKTLGLLRDWLKVRKAKRAPETEKALTLNLDKLESLSCESGLTIPAYLEAVIARGWAAFYPIRDGIQQGQRPANRQQDERSRIKSEAEHAQGGHASGFGW